MGSKYTPGTWEVKSINNNTNLLIDSKYIHIAQIIKYGNPQEKNSQGDIEIARLIAAAPELLEALKELVPITWNDGPLAKAYEAIGKQAEQAIAKATKEGEK